MVVVRSNDLNNVPVTDIYMELVIGTACVKLHRMSPAMSRETVTCSVTQAEVNTANGFRDLYSEMEACVGRFAFMKAHLLCHVGKTIWDINL